MIPGIYHIPGYGMVYDPNQIRIEDNTVYRLQQPTDGGEPTWQELQGFAQPEAPMSPYATGALRAGTLGAAQPQGWPQMQQMAMSNPLPGILSMLGAASNLGQVQKPMAPAYQNPYINQLLEYM